MRPVRFYCESIEPQSLLDPVESNHLSRVLRLSVGSSVELFDGKGTLAWGTVEHIQKNRVQIQVTKRKQATQDNTGNIILAVSFAKGQRFDWLVEKCTELGADHIAAVQFERTVKLGNATSVQRLSRITISAAKQCERLCLPKLTGPAKLKETADYLRSEYPHSIMLYGSPDGKSSAEFFKVPTKEDVVVFIGPEGGFSESEIDYFDSLEAVPVSINKNILRIETAAVAFCSLLRQI